MNALVVIIPALIVAGIIIYASVLVHAWRRWDGPPSHSLDCLDKRRLGIIPPDCLADHPTDWFAIPATKDQQ